jgi:hypothetical protein
MEKITMAKWTEGPNGELIEITPIEPDAGEGSDADVEHGLDAPGDGEPGGKKKGKSDYQVALESMELWKKPLAFFGGSLWSINEVGSWVVVDSEYMALLAKLRGRSGKSILFDILAPMLNVPSLDQVERPSCYWEYETRNGSWVQFRLGQNQVLFTDAIVELPVGGGDGDEKFIPLHGRRIFGAQITVPYASETGDVPQCEEFNQLVEHCFPDEEQRRHFQELAGLILQPHVMLRGQIALYGPAYCGKTTLATALACAPAGARGLSAVQEAEITRDKWASLSLMNKFVNISDESRPTELWVSWMKRYTSGTFLVEPKFHKSMWVPSTAKLISTTNELQDMADVSGAAGLRFFPFKLDRRLPMDAGVSHTDRMTPEYWSEPSRRAGVVAWLLEGLRRLWARGGKLQEPKSWTVQKAEAMAVADPIEGWLLDELIRDESGVIPHGELIALAPPMVDSCVKSLEMKLKGYMTRLFGAVNGRVRVGGIPTRVWKGVRLK